MHLKKLLAVAVGLTVSLGLVSPAHAIFGIGVHYDIDASVKMPDAENEQLVFEDLQLSTLGSGFTIPGAPNVLEPEDIPIFFDRTSFSRTPFGLGGKLYIDILPLIDCIEIGGDIAAWEYNGVIRYPLSVSAPSYDANLGLIGMIEDPASAVDIVYDTMDMSLEANGAAFPGISGVPYVKLNMGVTIRKYLSIRLIDRFIKPYAGAGFDIHFATPVPSAGLIKDALGDALLGEMSIAGINDALTKQENRDAIVKEILGRLMTPHYGMNIVAGTIIKPPIVPFGIYADGRLMIPFGPFDEDAEVTGAGFKLNIGLVLHIGKSAN